MLSENPGLVTQREHDDGGHSAAPQGLAEQKRGQGSEWIQLCVVTKVGCRWG